MNDLGYQISEKYEYEQDMKYKVYTPKEIANYILTESIKEYFSDRDIKDIEKLSLIDISCGSGNFLVEALIFLLEEYKKIHGVYRYFDNWITGYDIDRKALEICKERLNRILKRKGIKNYKLKIYEKDSLVEKINKKYDIVIGNPPYIGEKSHKELFQKIKESAFGKKYYEAKMDYFYFFIEKGIDILKDNGILTYITTNYWLKADSARKLRLKIKEECDFYIADDLNCSVFKRAMGQHNIIFGLVKKQENRELKLKLGDNISSVENSKIYNENGKIVLASEMKLNFFRSILDKRSFNLGERFNINQGIVSGCDKAFVFNEYSEIFSDYLKPFYKSSDINNYSVDENRYWILYLSKEMDKNYCEDKVLIDYLKEYKEKLEKRREVKKGFINWYNLQWARKEEIFRSKKIIARQRASKNLFAYSDKAVYGSADIYYLTPKDKISLYYVLGYLNSELFFDWFYYQGKRKGKNLELYSTPLKEVPVYYPEDSEKIKYVEDLVKSQIENYSDENQIKINEFFRGEI